MSRLEEAIEIQKEIEDASYKLAKLEGKEEDLESKLKDKYKCKNTKKLRVKISRLTKALKEKRSFNERRLTRLNKVFNDNS